MDARQQREWRRKNPDKVREYNRRAVLKHGRRPVSPAYARGYHLMRKYGLTAGAWERLFVGQGQRCKICRSDHPFGKYWHTDHAGPLPCTPGRVRGILCLRCNHSIGKGGRDDLWRLEQQAIYIREWLS